MEENSRKGLFRKRNVLGTALVFGIGLGIYFGQFKGFGLGGSGTWGIGAQSGDSQVSTGKDGEKTPQDDTSPDSTKSDDGVPITIPECVKVVIDEKAFFLRQSNVDTPIELSKLIQITKRAPGDADGVRIRIYLKATSRASAEEKLKQALANAGIAETAVFWVPTPVK